ncbi:MAG: 50S ribosomal protein L22 [Clostridia bacterium]
MATRISEKAKAREINADKRPRAIAKFIRISPDKVRIVLDAIRGKSLTEAKAVVKFVRKAACEPIEKLLDSAAANAENNLNMNKSELYVAECFANAGPTLKRMTPRAKGSAGQILKRTSHITIILDEMAK